MTILLTNAFSDLVIKKETSNIAYVTNQLHTEAEGRHQMPKVEELAYTAYDEQNKVVAGIVGYLMYGSLLVDILWVNKRYRGQGYGKRLIQNLEQEAAQKGAKFSILLAMSFWENLEFYKKQGYVIISTQEGFSNGAKQYLLRKNLQRVVS